MSLKDEINKAIGAHGMWKVRLKNAVATGKTEVPIPKIKVDNQCDFGKWLYGTTITFADKNSDHYKKVKELHAKFHEIAGKAAELATSGKKEEAEKMINTGGEYAKASAALSAAMMAWLDSAK